MARWKLESGCIHISRSSSQGASGRGNPGRVARFACHLWLIAHQGARLECGKFDCHFPLASWEMRASQQTGSSDVNAMSSRRKLVTDRPNRWKHPHGKLPFRHFYVYRLPSLISLNKINNIYFIYNIYCLLKIQLNLYLLLRKRWNYSSRANLYLYVNTFTAQGIYPSTPFQCILIISEINPKEQSREHPDYRI